MHEIHTPGIIGIEKRISCRIFPEFMLFDMAVGLPPKIACLFAG
ncbi:MAG: hypothetical protein N2645_22555 [Clostridia bacterium]|nr:hypothetical protein [Clostridia bacterium]